MNFISKNIKKSTFNETNNITKKTPLLLVPYFIEFAPTQIVVATPIKGI